jgi:hypothetical protein
MKTNMPRFRPEGPRSRRAFAVIVILAGACRASGLLGENRSNHPVELVGAWVDLVKSTPADTALWLLGAEGEDASQHVTRRDARTAKAPAGDSFELSSAEHYGYWFFRGAMVDTARRSLCITRRPRRVMPTCVHFDLDTIATAAGPRRRLRLAQYEGEHRTSDRVLVAREP